MRHECIHACVWRNENKKRHARCWCGPRIFNWKCMLRPFVWHVRICIFRILSFFRFIVLISSILSLASKFFISFSTSFYFFLSLFERFSTYTVCPASFLSRFAARKLSALPFVLHLSLDFMLLYWNLYRDLDKDFYLGRKGTWGIINTKEQAFLSVDTFDEIIELHRVAEYICMHTP